MFVMQPRHMEAMEAVTREAFHQRVLERLNRTAPTVIAKWPPGDVPRLFAEADRRAAAHGVRSYRDHANWILLSAIAGVRFHEAPAVAQVLESHPGGVSIALADLLAAFSDAARSVAARSSVEGT